MQHEQKFEICGLFRIVSRKVKDDSISQDTGWFHNLITDSGMDAIASKSVISGVAVGRGTTPESVNDVSLSVFAARTDSWAPNGQPSISIGSAVEPYFQKCVATWRFSEGVVTGNLSEVGVIHTYSSPNWPLWSRTLIRDSNGDPVTITILPDEYLDVMYEARVYPQDVQYGGDVVLMGNTHSYRVGGRAINTSGFGYIFTYGMAYMNGPYTRANNGPLSPSPSNERTGTQVVNTSAGITAAAYVNGSFERKILFKLSPGTGTGSIRSMNLATSGSFGPSYAVELTPAFEKAETVELSTVIKLTWARRPV